MKEKITNIAKVALYWKQTKMQGTHTTLTLEKSQAQRFFTKWRFMTFEQGRSKFSLKTKPLILHSDKVKVL